MTPSTVLITGAAGFLGGAIARVCRRTWPDARVVGVDMRGGLPGVDTVCDLADKAGTSALVRDVCPDMVLHMAGVTGGSDWQMLWSTHVLALANVLDGVMEHAPGCRLVIPSSAAEYGEADPSAGPITEARDLMPTSPYGVSKAWQTVLARSYAARGADVIMGRVFNLAGAGVPPHFVLGRVANQLRRIACGELPAVVRLGDLRAVRDFIDVDDACRALLSVALGGRAGQVYNVCSGVPNVIGDVVRLLVDVSDTGAELAVSPAATSDRGNLSWSVGSNAKILAETEWRPQVDLIDSLRRMLA
jgi:GDP-4-dehydro-6-deoxy-D-mannose reductase